MLELFVLLIDNNSYIQKGTSKATAIQPSPLIILSIQIMADIAFK